MGNNNSSKNSKSPALNGNTQFKLLLNFLGKLSRGSSENTVLVIASMSMLAFFATLALFLCTILVGPRFLSCPAQAQEMLETLDVEEQLTEKIPSES